MHYVYEKWEISDIAPYAIYDPRLNFEPPANGKLNHKNGNNKSEHDSVVHFEIE